MALLPNCRTCLAGAWLPMAILSLSACEHAQTAAPVPQASPAAVHGAPLAGLRPTGSDLRGASDETGAAAIGATDSGPRLGAAGAAPEASGGDGGAGGVR